MYVLRVNALTNDVMVIASALCQITADLSGFQASVTFITVA